MTIEGQPKREDARLEIVGKTITSPVLTYNFASPLSLNR